MKALKKFVRWTILLIFLLSIIPYFIPVPDSVLSIHDLKSPSSRFIKLGDVTIHYHHYPHPDPKGTVVFIHGFGGSLFSFRDNAEPFLAENLEVVLIDLPGFGLSERTLKADYSHLGRAQLLYAFGQELGLAHPVHWVGHSMGGSILSWLPTIDSQAAASLTLVAAPFSVQPSSNWTWLIEKYPPVWRYLKIGLPRFITEERVGNLLRSAYGRPLSDYEIRGYLNPLLVENNHYTFIGLTRDRTVTYPDFESIQVPVLLLWGEDDTWVPATEAPHWHRMLPQSRIQYIPLAGHNPMETHTDIFNEILIEFFQDPLMNTRSSP